MVELGADGFVFDSLKYGSNYKVHTPTNAPFIKFDKV